MKPDETGNDSMHLSQSSQSDLNNTYALQVKNSSTLSVHSGVC